MGFWALADLVWVCCSMMNALLLFLLLFLNKGGIFLMAELEGVGQKLEDSSVDVWSVQISPL